MNCETYWLSGCKNFGIVETAEGNFDVYYRLYSELANHDFVWFPTYAGARNSLKKEHFLETRMKNISRDEFEKAI